MTRKHATSLYAACGSNLHPQRLQERIKSAALRGTSFLGKYTLQFHKRVAAVPVIGDPDPVRRERNWRTIERLKRE